MPQAMHWGAAYLPILTAKRGATGALIPSFGACTALLLCLLCFFCFSMPHPAVGSFSVARPTYTIVSIVFPIAVRDPTPSA